ncbi:hypothetical protein PENCOP_c001G07618 [Penicillium coprophilum]|uniref:Uncharacterized protein n=1 Tax=Penicillium coprophilum TaxID=36646 RepID=A0A1V6V991_9EURO|nr:hypothetical protein PENCOP_c001G07618 [Penicillium coprophilum]
MTANRSVSINYWRYTASALSPQTSMPEAENVTEPEDLSQTRLLPAPALSPQQSMPDNGDLPEPTELSQDELLAKNFYRTPGVHVIIMPKVKDMLAIQGSEELCRKLAKKFFLPEFFFRDLGWNANGMFGSTENMEESDEEASYGTFSRFLSKKVKPKNQEDHARLPGVQNTDLRSTSIPDHTYTWHYMAFCTLWRSCLGPKTETGRVKTDGSNDTTLLLCFDLDNEVVLRLRRLLHSADLKTWNEDPFLMLDFALSIVVDQCEEDLWSFQKPVRDIEERRRQEPVKEIGSDDDDEAFRVLMERYNQLHELSRHVIHISETMDAASNNLGAIVRDHDMWSQSISPSAATKRLSKALLLRQNLISNLNFRAKAFVARMDNEIKCASNFVAVGDSNISKGILKQTRNEGRILSDTVSALTLLFLPGTFISVGQTNLHF